MLVMAVLVLLAFALLAWRLHVLQVQRHEDLARQAESNRTAIVPIAPHRGDIIDRNGVVLATNYKAYTLEVTPSRVDRPIEQLIDDIAQLVPVTPRDRRRFLRQRADSRSFDSVPIRMRLTDEEVARMAGQLYRFPGVEIKARLLRTYPLGDLGAHIIGYIGRINAKEQEEIEDSEDAANYRGTDYIGKLGVEKSYEALLHGTTGVEQLETSSGGHAVRLLERRPARSGDSLQLSIDIKLQKLVEDLYGKRRGALVAIDPRNGEILAFVSKPTFDPNLFVEGIGQSDWDALNNSIDRPLLNRALRGTYPPGSTYKPFMALAGLKSGKRTPQSVTVDRGSWSFGGHTFRGHATGAVNLHSSIVRSSNVYYYQLANDLGVNAIHDFMKPLGFGQITGIDLPGEVRGVLPSTQWKRSAYKKPAQQKWYAGETISLGIGQGYNNFTMLQLASATATLAADGVRHTPHLGQRRIDALDGTEEALPQPAGEPLLRPAHVQLVRRAMVGVAREGTSWRIFAGAPYQSGGKTGTAQAVSLGKRNLNARLAERQRDHALYIAFAPADEPRIAVAAIVENAGFGAISAAPIVRRVLDYWLLGQWPSDADMHAVQRGQASAPIGEPKRASDITLLATRDGQTVAAEVRLSPASAAAEAASAAAAASAASAAAAASAASAAASAAPAPKKRPAASTPRRRASQA
ncbi:MAG: penicillin-binding protein 2, partial [Ottowia sp.]|nr:penicillin-binding protein 2 [Ottowia sp.]